MIFNFFFADHFIWIKDPLNFRRRKKIINFEFLSMIWSWSDPIFQKWSDPLSDPDLRAWIRVISESGNYRSNFILIIFNVTFLRGFFTCRWAALSAANRACSAISECPPTTPSVAKSYILISFLQYVLYCLFYQQIISRFISII